MGLFVPGVGDDKSQGREAGDEDSPDGHLIHGSRRQSRVSGRFVRREKW